ncbi:MAG: efflux RND transporter periplasmic adaptor subunit [Oceanipulchritudo sp.]
MSAVRGPVRKYPLNKGFTLFFLLAGLLALPGCGEKQENKAAGGGYPVSAVVAPVEKTALEEKIFLVGSLEAIDEVDLISEVDARVVELNFEEGETVQKGQLLIQLDARKLEASLAEMRSRYQLAKTDLDRAAILLERETISEQDYDQAEAEFDAARALLDLAEERLEDATIRAPFDGIMTERLISPGQYTSRGQKLASLVQMHPLDVEFNVPERYIGQLESGQRIEIGVEAYPEEAFEGEVVFISPRVDRASRTVLVKARVGNVDRRLKPGMFGNLELIFQARGEALVIPEAAISYTGDKATVVVMNAEGKAEFRPVEVGIRLAGKAEILSGLETGERVVVEGFQKMGPGTTVQVSIESRRYGIEPDA